MNRIGLILVAMLNNGMAMLGTFIMLYGEKYV